MAGGTDLGHRPVPRFGRLVYQISKNALDRNPGQGGLLVLLSSVPPVSTLQPPVHEVQPQKPGVEHGRRGVEFPRLDPVHERLGGQRRILEAAFLRRTPEFLRHGVERERLEPLRRRLGGVFPTPPPP